MRIVADAAQFLSPRLELAGFPARDGGLAYPGYVGELRLVEVQHVDPNMLNRLHTRIICLKA